jgi:hypothetical protein
MSVFLPLFLLTMTVMVELLESSSHYSLFSYFLITSLENEFKVQAIPNTLKNDSSYNNLLIISFQGEKVSFLINCIELH